MYLSQAFTTFCLDLNQANFLPNKFANDAQKKSQNSISIKYTDHMQCTWRGLLTNYIMTNGHENHHGKKDFDFQ